MQIWQKLLNQAAYGDVAVPAPSPGSRSGKGRELARALQISGTAVYNLLTMGTKPRYETLVALSRYFAVPVTVLLLESGPDDDLNIRLAKVFDLSPESKQRVADFITGLPSSVTAPREA